MSYTVYAIKSNLHNYIYVGFTNNIDRRIKEHNSGKTKSTQYYRPFTLIYQKQVETRVEARKFEKKLKSGAGKEYLKKYINHKQP